MATANAPVGTLAFTGPPAYVRLAGWLALGLVLLGALMVVWARRADAVNSLSGA